MRIRPLAARLAATALLTLATAAAGALPANGTATAPARSVSAAAAYELTLSSDTPSTDFGHRTVNLTGSVTRADGTPVAGAPVRVGQSVLYRTWNPWGDPIDPTERESRSLGTLHTDQNGRFALPSVQADRWDAQSSIFVDPLNRVEFYASYDPPEDPSEQDIAFARTTVRTEPVPSTLTYKVNKTRVREGDILTVTGKVSWPKGHGPVSGTRVLLRTYFESQYNAETITDAKGHFSVSSRISDYDNEFVIFSAPKDYYIAGASHELPVENVTP